MYHSSSPRKRAKRLVSILTAAICIIEGFSFNAYAEEEYQLEIDKKTLTKMIDEISPDLDISKVSGIGREDFVWAIENCTFDKDNVLGDNAEYIWNLCQRYNVNEWAICGIIAAESQWASSPLAKNKKNIMSITGDGGYKTYESYSRCIRDGIRLLATQYISPEGEYATGGVLKDIAETYAGEEYAEEWVDLVVNCTEMCTRSIK